MHEIGKVFVALIAFMLRFGIQIAFAIWVIIAIKRLLDGIKRLSARLDLIEQILLEKGDLEKA